MNFNVYLEDTLSQKLNQICQVTGKKRNALIREALEFWVSQYAVLEWPQSIKDFQGNPEAIPFESYRSELPKPKEEGIF